LGTNDLRKAVIYSCNLDGTGYKKLGTITCPDGKGIGIAKFTSKYCVYYEGVRDYTGNTIYNYTYYKYTYSTKTKKKISKKEYYKLMGI
jgi:hypothetical protein